MGNAPVIRITGLKVQDEYIERFGNWANHVYYPHMLESQWIAGNERYQIVKESPDYVRNIGVSYHQNRRALEQWYRDKGVLPILEDLKTWGNRGTWVWEAAYQLLKIFRNDSPMDAKELLRVDQATIMHLEGFWLSAAEEEKYQLWFTKWGYEVYIPLLMKLPGLKQYNYYKIIDFEFPEWQKVSEPNVHPIYLSILHFDDVKAFENYEKSLEHYALKGALKTLFPRGLDYKWYVQYRVLQSGRK